MNDDKPKRRELVYCQYGPNKSEYNPYFVSAADYAKSASGMEVTLGPAHYKRNKWQVVKDSHSVTVRIVAKIAAGRWACEYVR